MTGSLDIDPWLVLPGKVAPGSYDALLTLGERADAAGWHTLAVPDSAFALGFHDSTVALAALAARTRRARLAVACMSTLGLRNPLVVAQQWANLDALSGGRMTLIACPGNRTGAKHERELAAFGVGYDEKVERMTEAVALLRAASTNAALDFEGRFTSVHDVELVPAFVQRPLPVWLTTNPSRLATPAGLERLLVRVATLADGWLTYNVRPQDLQVRVDLLHRLRDELAVAGTPPPSGRGRIPVVVQVRFTLADTDEKAQAEAQEAWARSATRGISTAELTDVFAVGTPARALDLISRLVRAGATAVALSPLGADPADQIDRATAELLPHLVGTATTVSG